MQRVDSCQWLVDVEHAKCMLNRLTCLVLQTMQQAVTAVQTHIHTPSRATSCETGSEYGSVSASASPGPPLPKAAGSSGSLSEADWDFAVTAAADELIWGALVPASEPLRSRAACMDSRLSTLLSCCPAAALACLFCPLTQQSV